MVLHCVLRRAGFALGVPYVCTFEVDGVVEAHGYEAWSPDSHCPAQALDCDFAHPAGVLAVQHFAVVVVVAAVDLRHLFCAEAGDNILADERGEHVLILVP